MVVSSQNWKGEADLLPQAERAWLSENVRIYRKVRKLGEKPASGNRYY